MALSCGACLMMNEDCDGLPLPPAPPEAAVVDEDDVPAFFKGLMFRLLECDPSQTRYCVKDKVEKEEETHHKMAENSDDKCPVNYPHTTLHHMTRRHWADRCMEKNLKKVKTYKQALHLKIKDLHHYKFVLQWTIFANDDFSNNP